MCDIHVYQENGRELARYDLGNEMVLRKVFCFQSRHMPGSSVDLRSAGSEHENKG